jgi:SAM-dependent methyltransferase
MTPWRKEVYKALRKSRLRGQVLDVGGSRKSGYHELLTDVEKFVVVNLDPTTEPDYRLNLEDTFPLQDDSYDGILCMNILEHIYHYRGFLSECYRVSRKNGMLVIAVPFLLQVHRSPHDYFRFTDEALLNILTEAGFHDISITPLGSGVGLAVAQLLYNTLRYTPLRSLVEWKGRLFDTMVSVVQKDSFLSGTHYPLGYFITARKL